MHSDMFEWTEIRRKVLVEGVSKRSIRRDYKIGSDGAREDPDQLRAPRLSTDRRPPETSARQLLERHRRDPGVRQDRTEKAASHGQADLRTLARRIRLHRVLLTGTRRGCSGQGPPKGGLRASQPPAWTWPVRLRRGRGGDRGCERKAHFAVMTLPYSDTYFISAYPRSAPRASKRATSPHSTSSAPSLSARATTTPPLQ